MSEIKNIPLEMRDSTVINLKIEFREKKRWLVITHGVCEYLERYDILSNRFQHYNILRYDLRGHGQSEGKRFCIEHFADYAKDLSEIIDFVQKNYHMDEYVLFGHSMGGLINAQFIQNGWHLQAPFDLSHRLSSKHKMPILKLLFMSSPCIKPANVLVTGLQLLPKIKNLGLSKGLNLKAFVRESLLSHATKTNPIYQDLHLLRMSISFKLLCAIHYYSKKIFSKALSVECPIKAIIGTGDSIVSVSAFINYFETYLPKAEVVLIEGGFHELMHESEPYVSEYFKFLDKALIYSEIEGDEVSL